jgi:hypothetical protein
MLDVDSAKTPDSEVWDHDTGETWGEARARFATFGPLLTAQEALDAFEADPSLEGRVPLMSFGYGDDPVDFDEVDRDALRESVEEDGSEAVTGYWGPFAFWTEEA